MNYKSFLIAFAIASGSLILASGSSSSTSISPEVVTALQKGTPISKQVFNSAKFDPDNSFEKDEVVIIRDFDKWVYAKYVRRDGQHCILNIPSKTTINTEDVNYVGKLSSNNNE